MSKFLEKVKESNKLTRIDTPTYELQNELLGIIFYQCEHPGLEHLKEGKELDVTHTE